MGVGFGIIRTSGSGGGGGGTTITTVANYSALPLAVGVSGKFYWCEASQGTKWLPGSLGGTYYPLGMYYSNGVTWEYSETPYQATLGEVNTGTNTDKFVSPYTFTNADKWGDYTPTTRTISTTAPLQGGGNLSNNRTLSITQSNATTDGYLSSADWNTFSGKQNTITLTTTGSSGASTFISNTLNVPTYTLSGLGGVPTSRQLTINGTAFDLSADRSWTVGTVTSVGLTMPTAFTVTNSPITGSGVIAVTGAGLSSQYIRGDGQLATFPTSGGGGSSVYYYLNGSVAASVATYKQLSNTAIVGVGTDFTLTGNGLITQFLTDVGNPNRNLIPSGAWNFEMFFSMSSSGGNTKFYVELLKYNGTTFTSIASTIAIPEAITGGTTIDLYLTSLAVPETVLLTTDRLAVRVYIVDNSGGRTVTLHTEDNHLCQITTTFSGGISSLNGLTANTQYLAVGTSGTDFNISSVTDTHTFNLPTASATNRGALSSADWTIFNNKQDVITLGNLTNASSDGITITGGTNAVNGTGVEIFQQVSNATKNGYLSSADWSTFNGKQNTISLTTSGTSGASTFISNTLNVPTYTLSGLGGVPTSRQLTINGTAFDLSADRSWTVGTVTSVSALTLGTSGTDLSSTVANGTTTPIITLNVPTASATNRGALSSTDWSTFNGKQNALTIGNLTDVGSDGISVTGGTGAIIGSGVNISQQVASATQNGYLSSTDWVTFNSSAPSFIPALTASAIPGGYYANNASATFSVLGNVSAAALSGTASAITQTNTSVVNRTIRIQIPTSSTVGSRAAIRTASLRHAVGQGFSFSAGWCIQDAAYVAGAKQFHGLLPISTLGTLSNTVDNSSLTNFIGVGSDAGDLNLQVFYNDATGTASKIDLGANFPANRTAGAVLDKFYVFDMYNGYDTMIVKYKITDRVTGNTAEGTISTDLPDATILLCAQSIRTNGVTALATITQWSHLIGYML